MNTLLANLKRAAWDRETVTIGGGEFSPQEITQAMSEIETLKDALYRALPFVEDALDDPAYKRERVAEALAQVCKALGEPV